MLIYPHVLQNHLKLIQGYQLALRQPQMVRQALLLLPFVQLLAIGVLGVALVCGGRYILEQHLDDVEAVVEKVGPRPHRPLKTVAHPQMPDSDTILPQLLLTLP